jgi:hypothetical protein
MSRKNNVFGLASFVILDQKKSKIVILHRSEISSFYFYAL